MLADPVCCPSPSAGIWHQLTAATGDCDSGKVYSTSITLDTSGDHTYYFEATDGNSNAVGSPTDNSIVTVLAGTNNPPQLDWVVDEDVCFSKGVRPTVGLESGDFTFRVKYTDPDNTCPADGVVSVVVVGDTTYTLDQHDGADCDEGRTYYRTIQLATDAGDQNYTYYFTATDGTDSAVGDPVATTGNEVTVVSDTNAIGVRQGSDTGPISYNSIQLAVDAVNNAHTVLVYDGTYSEDVEFDRFNDNTTTLRSVCGPDMTIINGSGSGSTVTFTRNGGSQLDGFQVTGGTIGIHVSGSQTSVNNCLVHSNSNSGIYAGQTGDVPTLTLTNSEIYNNTSDRGAGVSIWRGTGHTISNSIIRDNTTTGDSLADGGGGLHVFQVGTLAISNSVISDNESVDYAGGGLYITQVAELTISDSIISGNTTNASGGGVYNNQSTINFIRSRITGNTAGSMGGAIRHPSAASNVSFENCIVADNRADKGGMAFVNGGTFDIVNSTIANNQAMVSTGGMIHNQLATVTIRNSILWGNQAATGGHIASFNGGSMTISDSIIESGYDGNFTNPPFFSGNVTPVINGFVSEDDPWFAGDGDYHIPSYSTAVDNASATYAPGVDIDGQGRPQGVSDDIGAYEYVP